MPDSDTQTVFFLMPDGQKVSNDPRHFHEEYRAKMLESMSNTGNAVEVEFIDPASQAGVEEASTDGNEAPVDLESMTGAQLKDYVKALRDNGVEVDVTGVKTKADLVKAIEAAQG